MTMQVTGRCLSISYGFETNNFRRRPRFGPVDFSTIRNVHVMKDVRFRFRFEHANCRPVRLLGLAPVA